MNRLFMAVTALLLLAGSSIFSSSQAAPVALFDASPGSSPSSQGWTYIPQPFAGNKAVQSLSAAGARLDTTATATDKAGYFSRFPPFSHPANPLLKRGEGYVIKFGARLLSELHNSPNRAGLSLIALSDDHKGIELGFWTDRVFAQSGPDFLHAEEGMTDTTLPGLVYELKIKGDTYTLSVGGAPILSGPLRDYSSFGSPYTIANFLFVGDDTSSASASFDWTLLSHEAVPAASPATLGPIGFEAGSFKLTVSGVAGSSQRVEYSDDLQIWHELQTVTLGATPAIITDSLEAPSGRKFYRAIGL